MSTKFLKDFYISFAVLVVGLILSFLWAGTTGVMIAIILFLLEISLSFDNSVINASILNKMTPIWRRRFLTWGMLIAVFGMRLVFPILLIAITGGISLVTATSMAFSDPIAYKELLLNSHYMISSFGGMFLVMVFLDFMIDDNKTIKIKSGLVIHLNAKILCTMIDNDNNKKGTEIKNSMLY